MDLISFDQVDVGVNFDYMTVDVFLNYMFIDIFLDPGGVYVFFHQFSSVTQLCLTLYDLIDCSTPGFPVHHQPFFFARCL